MAVLRDFPIHIFLVNFTITDYVRYLHRQTAVKNQKHSPFFESM